MKRKGKVSELSYEQQNHIQDIASRYGCILTYQQMQQYARYRADKAFSESPDQAVLYLVLTPTQRERFDQVKTQYGF